MQRLPISFAVITTALVAPSAMQADQAGGYASDHIIIRLRPAAANAIAIQGARVRDNTMPLPAGTLWEKREPAGMSVGFQALWRRWEVLSIRRAYPFTFRNAQAAARVGLDRIFILDVPRHTDTRAMAAAFGAMGDEVEFAELDVIGTVAGGLVPNDPSFSLQYYMHNKGGDGVFDADVDAPEAWKIHTGGPRTVTVAIVDTGVDQHVEFSGRMVPGVNFADGSRDLCVQGSRGGIICCPGGGLCDDGICAGGTRNGMECCPGGACDAFTADLCQHGTFVAGVAAALGNNGVGIAGMSWGAGVMPVRVFSQCSGTATNTANGIAWAADHGADVINISLTFALEIQSMNDAIEYAVAQGALVVATAGNNDLCGKGMVCWPARFPNCMAVSGTTNRDEIATLSNTSKNPVPWSSNYGPDIDVAAPGDRIYSTIGVSGYAYVDGTSFASALVAGLASLLKSYEPTLTPNEMRKIISRTSDDLGEPGWDPLYGNGRVNAFKALGGMSSCIVDNVRASQRSDGSRNVEIWYDLSDPNGDTCRVSVSATDDSGQSWDVPINALSGELGTWVVPGSNKLIVWDSAMDLPERVGTFAIRVCAY